MKAALSSSSLLVTVAMVMDMVTVMVMGMVTVMVAPASRLPPDRLRRGSCSMCRGVVVVVGVKEGSDGGRKEGDREDGRIDR